MSAFKLSVPGSGADAENSENGSDVSVLFNMPDGTTFDFKAGIDATVEFLKSALNVHKSLPFNKLNLIYQGKSMLDPLSLSDFIAPGTKNITIKVEVKA